MQSKYNEGREKREIKKVVGINTGIEIPFFLLLTCFLPTICYVGKTKLKLVLKNLLLAFCELSVKMESKSKGLS